MAESTGEETPIKTSRRPEIQNQVDSVIRQLSKKRRKSDLRDINDEARHRVATKLRMDAVREELQTAKEQAYTDKLTGLPNRAKMMEIFKEKVKSGTPFKIALVDLDHFKQINDNYGHNVGDEILRIMGKQPVRAGELGRWGGEEFIMAIDEDTDMEGLSTLFSRQMEFMGEESAKVLSQYPGDREKMTMSIGVADFLPGVTSLDEVIENADKALYAVKQSTRNAAMYVSPTDGSFQRIPSTVLPVAA